MTSGKTLKYEQIKNFIEVESQSGCKLITTKQEFEKKIQNKKGSLVLLKIQCRCDNKNIFYKNYNKFKSANQRQCYDCMCKNKAYKRKIDGNIVYQAFINNDFTPLFKPADYKNSTQKLPYICNKHKDRDVQYISYTCVRRGQGCYQCGRDKGKGSNHYAWKDGVSSINEYLRRHLITWKKDSMKFNNFKCVITQTRFDEIHHIYSYESIVKKIFNTDTIPINPVNEYSEEELKSIEQKCIQLHYDYGFGICLQNDIHKLYHKEYGEGNNTPQQFLSFVQRLEAHEFDDYLKENNLTLNINYDILEKLLNQFGLSYPIKQLIK
ncbi:hypothetical protein [Clostridium sp.]|uniref:hypothetical protein n=1 Tax=Clostridium sp. TaxID=1506 RepID=UPI002616491E|nr:hypothetical protein [Clostridium sp.]